MRVHPPQLFCLNARTSPQPFYLNVGLSPKSPAKVRSACSADLVLTPIGSLEPLRFCLVANHIICFILEGATDYVERIRHTRCRQASGRWAESNGNNLKLLISGITTDWDLTLYQQVENWLLMADGFGVSSRWFPFFQQMVSVFPADDFCVSSRWFLCFHDAVFVSREQHALQPLALVFVSVRVLCAFAHTRVRTTIVLVQFSAKNLTHWQPFLRTNCPPRRKKSILAKVGFDAKRA